MRDGGQCCSISAVGSGAVVAICLCSHNRHHLLKPFLKSRKHRLHHSLPTIVDLPRNTQ